jgi:hypothetical protein
MPRSSARPHGRVDAGPVEFAGRALRHARQFLGSVLRAICARLRPPRQREILSGIPGSPTDYHTAPYAMTEEFTAVYRLHSLLPDEFSFRRQWAMGRDLPERPCTYCNKCRLNPPKNPMGCYEARNFPSRDAMIDELMTIYATRPTLNLPPVAPANPA